MKYIVNGLFSLLAVALLFTACDPLEDVVPDIGERPTADDVTFDFEYDADNANIVHFTNTSEGFILKWDLGNGSSAEGATATGIYPLAGEYEVTLTAYTKAGSAENTITITIDETDPTLLDVPAYNLLTGGVDALEGKTWVIDNENPGHMGVGPNDGGPDSRSPVYWEAPPNDKAGEGLYDDEMTFKLLDFQFDYNTNGDVFVNGNHAGDFGGDPAAGDQTVPYEAPDDLTWSYEETEDGRRFLTISNGGFFGFYTGVSRYEILNLEENELYLRYTDARDPALAWYHRLIPKGYTPPPPPGPTTITEYSLDFEAAEAPEFEGFGGSSYQAIANPDPSGVNTSANVGETVHGNETWAGIATALPGALVFGENTQFTMDVWGPVAGTVMMKLESSADPNNFKEVPVELNQTNSWQTLTFDFAGSPSGEWDRMALFFDFGSTDANTFYFDNIEFTKPTSTSLSDVSIDFETEEPVFDVFGGQAFQVIDNPDASGLNTSMRVGETVHGFESWAGISTLLDGPVDFSEKKIFKMNVWMPVTGTVKFKMENSSDNTDFLEVDVTNTKTNEWETLYFDFSAAPTEQYDLMALFFDFGSTEGNTFYFDDIELVSEIPAEPQALTEETLTGGSDRSWSLAPVAGALAVGPTKGSGDWFANAAEEVDGLRACWFDDEYIFASGGEYSYDANGDIYAEGYMGVDGDGCIAEGELPADAQAWTSATHSFSFTPASGDSPAYLTVTGTGAFIGLPKAYNGGEYATAPPTANASVTYEVLSYEVVDGKERIVLSIDISEGEQGTGFWRLTLEANE